MRHHAYRFILIGIDLSSSRHFSFVSPQHYQSSAHHMASPDHTMPSLQFVLAVSPDDNHNHASQDPSTGSLKRKEAPTLEYDDQTQTPPHSPFSPRRRLTLTKEHELDKDAKDITITPGECQN
jgi:hypothetical protein